MAKSKELFLSLLITTFIISGTAFLTATFSGCSGGIPVVENCIDCSQEPLIYQGTIQEYTQGVYLETACIRIDLTQFEGFGNIWETLKEGQMVQVWYQIKQGKFCEENDQSTYTIVPVEGTGTDQMRPSGLYGTFKGSQLTLKK